MRALIRIAKLVDADVLRDLHSIRAGRELFSAGALELRPGGAPLLVNHDASRIAGRVFELAELDDVGGRWAFARCEVDAPPDWLRPRTPASFGWISMGSRQEINGWSRCNRGMLTEVSLLAPGVAPFEPHAEVSALIDSPPVPAGQILTHESGTARRASGQILALR